MNYKLINYGFVEIKEKNGLVENNSNGIVEICITNSKPLFNDEGNIFLQPNCKYYFTYEEGKKVYARLVNRVNGKINVFETKNSEGGGGSALDNYYDKTESDERYVQKDGDKVLSDNNYSTEEKEKLAGFEYATENPLANGTANVGISTKIAREDHVHPSQTDITGNAGTATKLQTARTITLSGDATGSVEFDGSENVEISVTVSGGTGGGVPTTTQVIAGNGLDGGGALSGDITLNIVCADDSITVSENDIKLNIADDLTTDSSTRAGSARQLKVLDESKLGKTEKAQSATTADSCTGNSATATKLETPRAIKLTGAVTGQANFDGSEEANIETTLSNLDGSKINTLTGYVKGESYTAIETTDTLLTALGKLESGVENSFSKTGGTVEGNIVVTGTILSNDNITAYSDERLKENIEPITNALDKVKQLNGYTFNMIGQDKRQAGVIAQELQKVLPEVVIENSNGLLSVDYSKIVALLIEAIKELDRRK